MNNLKVDVPANKLAIIIGAGGAGGNILQYIYHHNQYGEEIDCCALDTDRHVLSALEIPLSNKLLIGGKGAGAGADPEKGKQAAIESAEAIIKKINSGNYKFAFVITGMGGGTGTGAAPVVAELCRSMGIYTIAICSTPFSFEDYSRHRQATEGIDNLKQHVDTITVFSNDSIINPDSSLTVPEAFNAADKIFYIPIDIICSILKGGGPLTHIDHRDIYTTLRGSKPAIFASGTGVGAKRITKALANLTKSPFLNHLKIEKSKRILLYIHAENEQNELLVKELEEVSDFFAEFSDGIELIWGYGYDSALKPDEIKVSVIVSGITDGEEVI